MVPGEDRADHFTVAISLDTVYHGEKATVEIIPKDKDDQPVEIGDDVSLKIDLDEHGAKYDTLLTKGLKGKSFEKIPYEKAKDKKLQDIVDGRNPLTADCCAPMIRVTACLADDPD